MQHRQMPMQSDKLVCQISVTRVMTVMCWVRLLINLLAECCAQKLPLVMIQQRCSPAQQEHAGH